MAKYLVLIYGDEQTWDGWSAEQAKSNHEGHVEFQAAAKGAILGGHQLQATDTATTVRADSAGRPTATDGPFLETKEALGGYYLIESADLDEAVSFVKLLRESAAPYSGVEIRPVVESS